MSLDPDSVCMQYKATHPLWGMRNSGWGRVADRFGTQPKPFNEDIRQAFLKDFRERCGITPDAWAALAPVLVYELREDLGVDSYFAIGFEGEFPEGHEYARLTLSQVLKGLRVRVALAERGR